MINEPTMQNKHTKNGSKAKGVLDLQTFGDLRPLTREPDFLNKHVLLNNKFR